MTAPTMTAHTAEAFFGCLILVFMCCDFRWMQSVLNAFAIAKYGLTENTRALHNLSRAPNTSFRVE